MKKSQQPDGKVGEKLRIELFLPLTVVSSAAVNMHFVLFLVSLSISFQLLGFMVFLGHMVVLC